MENDGQLVVFLKEMLRMRYQIYSDSFGKIGFLTQYNKNKGCTLFYSLCIYMYHICPRL